MDAYLETSWLDERAQPGVDRPAVPVQSTPGPVHPPGLERRLAIASLRAQVAELGRLTQAMSEALAEPDAVTPRADLVRRLGSRTVPRWHFAMLNDTARNEALFTAVRQQVRPGDHVVDIGTGTGLLAMMAARAGARRVTTFEENPLLAEIAREIVAVHGLSDVVTVVGKRSTDAELGHDLDAPADVVVSEIVDCGLIGEGLFPTMRHAREHLLRPGGRLVPRAARLLGCLVESEEAARLNRAERAAGFDVSLINAVATPGHFPFRLGNRAHRTLSDVVELASFDLLEDPLTAVAGTVALPLRESGTAHGLVAWFELDLGAGVVLRNSPEDRDSHWMQALLLFEEPVTVSAGRRLEARLRSSGLDLTCQPLAPISPGVSP